MNDAAGLGGSRPSRRDHVGVGVLGGQLTTGVRAHRGAIDALVHRVPPTGPSRGVGATASASCIPRGSPAGHRPTGGGASRPRPRARAPHDRRVRGGRAVGHPQLGLQGSVLERGVRGDAARPKLPHQFVRPAWPASPTPTTNTASPGSSGASIPSCSSARRTRSRPIPNPTPGRAARPTPRPARRTGLRRTAWPAAARGPGSRTRTPSACSSRGRGPASARASTRGRRLQPGLHTFEGPGTARRAGR